MFEMFGAKKGGLSGIGLVLDARSAKSEGKVVEGENKVSRFRASRPACDDVTFVGVP